MKDCAAMTGEVLCDAPNESLEDWDGNVHFTQQGKVVNAR
jgi:hypothetical protein